jgi:hypothetical protein
MSLTLHLLTLIEVLDVTFDDYEVSHNHRPLLVIDYLVFKDPATTSGLRPTFTRVTGYKLNDIYVGLIAGGDRDRTGDLVLAKHALSQLSYTPKR